MPTFLPPGRAGVRDTKHPFWRRLSATPISQHVWKDASGVWHEGQPTTDDIANALRYYSGGSRHTVTSAEQAELEAAGYTVDP